MPDNQITHRNHYVPQFYLKNWSQDGINIFVYSLLVSDTRIPYWSCKNIKSTAVWNDLYTRNEGQNAIDDFEKWFDKEFETPAKKVIDSLINNHNLNKDESEVLSRFVAAQHLRTPSRLNDILALGRSLMPRALDDVLHTVSKLIKENPGIMITQPKLSEVTELLPIKVSVDSIDEETNKVKVESYVGKGYYLFALKHLLTNTVKVMYKQNWHVIHSSDEISFPTSDDPVICMNYNSEREYNFRGGWGKINGNIIMPISPTQILITEVGSKMSCAQLDYSAYWSQFFRKIIIEHAHRYVYSIKPQKGMLSINPRIINADLYEAEKDIMSGWHDEQMNAEAQLR